MGLVADRMEKLLLAAFAPTALSIIDESARHAGHSGARVGGESHFKVMVESVAFSGKSRVERHRMVYDAVKPLMEEGLHALAIEARVRGE